MLTDTAMVTIRDGERVQVNLKGFWPSRNSVSVELHDRPDRREVVVRSHGQVWTHPLPAPANT